MGLKGLSLWLCLLGLFLILAGLVSAQAVQASNFSNYYSYQSALVLTDCSDFFCTKNVAQSLRDANQFVSIVFPQQFSLIASINPERKTELLNLENISSIHFDNVGNRKFLSLSLEQQFSSRIWNNLLISKANNNSLPVTEFEFNELNDGLIFPEQQSNSARSSNGSSSINWADDDIHTSEYMIGDVWVGLMFPESNVSSSNTEDWTQAEVDFLSGEVVLGLNFWDTKFDEQNFNSGLDLVFYLDIYDPFTTPSIVDTGYEPITLTTNQMGFWIDEVLGNLGYSGYPTSPSGYDRMNAVINDERNTNGYDWGYFIWNADATNDLDGQFEGGSPTAFANVGGPAHYQTAYNGITSFSIYAIYAHETGHIFWALDQYSSSAVCQQAGCTYSVGYLNVQNQNCDIEPQCATDVPSIMRSNTEVVDYYAAGQIGWWDSDVDGIPDVLDSENMPTLSVIPYEDPTTENNPSLNGSCDVGVAVDNQNPFGFPRDDITIVKINDVQYRADNGSWASANPSDGSFDSQSEAFDFTASLQNSGTPHLIEAKAIDSLGHESSIASDSFIVWGTVGESCDETAACSTNFCHPDKQGQKFCVSSENNCALEGSEVVSEQNTFAKFVVNREANNAMCFEGYWGADPLLASPPSTAKEVEVIGGQTNTTVSIALPKVATVIDAHMYISAMGAIPITNIEIDIGNDGSVEKAIAVLSEIDSPELSDFTNQLNTVVQTCDAFGTSLSRGICTVTIGVTADDSGTLLLHGLDVEYDKWLPIIGGTGSGFMQDFNYVKDVLIGLTHSAITTDYTFSTTIDTASIIAAGNMLSNCNDLRVFDTVSQTELDRDIQNCNTATTTVFWKASQTLAENSPDSTTYKLFYGNPIAGSDYRDLKNVYYGFDDFDDGVLDLMWDQVSGVSETGGNLVITSTGSGAGAIASGTNLPYNSFMEVELKSSTNQESGYLGLNVQTDPTTGYDNSDAGLFQFTGAWGAGSMDGYINGVGQTNIDTYSANTFKKYKFDLTSTDTRIFSDSGSGYIERYSSATTTSEFSIHPYFTVFCVSGCAQSTEVVTINWMKVQHYLDIEPSLTIGVETENGPDNNIPVMGEVPDKYWVAGYNDTLFNLWFEASDADLDALQYNNSYDLQGSFYSTDWGSWNSSFSAMNQLPNGDFSYWNSMYSGQSDAGIYYVISSVTDGIATVGQIIEINLLPNNSRPIPSSPVKFECNRNAGDCDDI